MSTNKVFVLLKGFNCIKCNLYRSTIKTLYNKHKLACNLEAPTLIVKPSYKCKFCDKNYAHSLSLEVHLKVRHGDEEEAVCRFCKNKIFKNQMKIHRKHCLKESKKCPFCPATFAKREPVKQHVTLIHTTEKCFKCDQCGGNFKLKHTMKRHINRVHSEWKCKKCDEKFPRKVTLARHMQDSHAKDGFNCNLCKNTFTAYKYLVFHEDRYHSTKEFQCQVCLKLFSLPSHLKRHQKAFHFRETQFMCCKENFGTLQNMLSHEELVHKGKRWRCIQCFKVCSTQNMLDRHMNKPHREKSPCPECGLMMSPKALKCHFTLVHRTDKVPCDECNDSFVSDKSLKKHKNIRHFKIKIEE